MTHTWRIQGFKSVIRDDGEASVTDPDGRLVHFQQYDNPSAAARAMHNVMADYGIDADKWLDWVTLDDAPNEAQRAAAL